MERRIAYTPDGKMIAADGIEGPPGVGDKLLGVDGKEIGSVRHVSDTSTACVVVSKRRNNPWRYSFFTEGRSTTAATGNRPGPVR